MVLVRAFGVQFPPDELVEICDMLYELWSFSFKVLPGTDLEVPWVSYESELEQFVEKLLRQHLFCGDDSCVARKLTCDTVTGSVTEPAGDELGDVKWILPS